MDKYKIKDLKERLDKESNQEHKNKMLYMWIKQGHISLQEYNSLVQNLGDIGHVSKPFKEDARVKITENTSGHEFDIDEIVTIVEFEPQYSQWNCIGKDGAMWYIGEHEGNVC